MKKTLLMMTLPLISAPAIADWPFELPPYLAIGVDAAELNTSRPVFCDRKLDTVRADLGQEFTVFGIEFNSRLSHISCASVTNDRNTYNAIGIQAKFYLWSKK